MPVPLLNQALGRDAKQRAVSVVNNSYPSLAPTKWVKDDVVNGFFQLLRNRSLRCGFNHHFFSSFFFAKLMDEKCTNTFQYVNVQSWSRDVDLFALDKVFVPINIRNMHWTCLVANMQQRKILYLDSLGGDGTYYIGHFFSYLSEEWNKRRCRRDCASLREDQWTFISRPARLPQQPNSFDCGIFVCLFADILSLDGCKMPTNFPTTKLNNTRLLIAFLLSKNESKTSADDSNKPVISETIFVSDDVTTAVPIATGKRMLTTEFKFCDGQPTSPVRSTKKIRTTVQNDSERESTGVISQRTLTSAEPITDVPIDTSKRLRDSILQTNEVSFSYCRQSSPAGKKVLLEAETKSGDNQPLVSGSSLGVTSFSRSKKKRSISEIEDSLVGFFLHTRQQQPETIQSFCKKFIGVPRSTFLRWFYDSGIEKYCKIINDKKLVSYQWERDVTMDKVLNLASDYAASLKNLHRKPPSQVLISESPVDDDCSLFDQFDLDTVSTITAPTFDGLVLSFDTMSVSNIVDTQESQKGTSCCYETNKTILRQTGKLLLEQQEERIATEKMNETSAQNQNGQLTMNAASKRRRFLGNKSEHSDAIIQNVLLAYTKERISNNPCSINNFASLHGIPKATFKRWLHQSGLCNMAAEQGWENLDCDLVSKVTNTWLASKKNCLQTHIKTVSASHRCLTDDEEKYILHAAAILGDKALGFTKAELMAIIDYTMNRGNKERDRIIPSYQILRLMRSRHPMKLKLRDPKCLDPGRAAQASEEVRDCFFQKYKDFIHNLHVMGSIPWSAPTEIPSECVYNMDEVAIDLTKHTNKVFVTDNSCKSIPTFLQTPEGDSKMNRHITVCVTTCGNGYYQFPKENQLCGAPPPFIVHEFASKKEDVEMQQNRHPVRGKPYTEQLDEEVMVPARFFEGFTSSNPCGFDVRASNKKGSMTTSLFFDYASHFIRGITMQAERMDIGPGHRPIILILDGHGSRWDIASLLMLIDSNIYPMFLPSKTSIWSQPNDNGVNYSLHKKWEVAAATMRRSLTKASLGYHNQVLEVGWELFVQEELTSLRLTGSNCAKSAYKKTGIHPFNPYCEAWENAITSLGQSKNTDALEEDSKIRYSVRCIKELAVAAKGLSIEERKYFPTYFGGGDIRDIAVGAQQIINDLLLRWSQEKGNQMFCPMSIKLTDSEMIALRLVEIRRLFRKSNESTNDESFDSCDRSDLAKTMLDHTKEFQSIDILYYELGKSQPESRQYKGVALRLNDTDWSVMVGCHGDDATNILQFQAKTEDLLNKEKYTVKVPDENVYSYSQKKQMKKQETKKLKEAEKLMREVAEKKIRHEALMEERQIFEEFVIKEWGSVIATFERFQTMIKNILKPIKRVYEIKNPITHLEENVVAYYERKEGEPDVSCIHRIVKDAVADIFATRERNKSNEDNKGEGNQNIMVKGFERKKGFVSTKRGANGFTALAQLLQGNTDDAKTSARAQLAKLSREVKALESNIDAFMLLMAEKPSSFWQINGTEKVKQCDVLLRLFFPDSGILGKKVNEKRAYLLNESSNQSKLIFTELNMRAKLQERLKELHDLKREISDTRADLMRMGDNLSYDEQGTNENDDEDEN